MSEYDDIREAVSMPDLCQRYGLEIDRSGYICCPFHNEKTPSLKVYPGTKGYYCFGCGVGGDVIDFAQKYFNLSSRFDAVKKLNADFGLHVIRDKPNYRENLAAGKATFERRMREAKKQKERERAEKEYWDLFDDWQHLRDIVKRRAPKTPDDDVDPVFLHALILLADVENELEYAEMKRWKVNYGRE